MMKGSAERLWPDRAERYNRPTVTKLAFFALASSAVFALLSCGGGDKTYEGNGFSFTYPGEWGEGEGESQVAGAQDPDGTVGPSERDNFAVWVLSGRQSLTEANLDQADADIEAFVRESYDRVLVPPTRTTVDGLPAHTFVAADVNSADIDLHYRETWVYDGTTWYHLLCQARIENADEMRPGCEQAVASFQIE